MKYKKTGTATACFFTKNPVKKSENKMSIDKKVAETNSFPATVLKVEKDRVQLYNEETGEKIWVEKKKLRVAPRKVMVYIQLPGYSSRHAGHDYGSRKELGFCLER
jgi:hypothetical protein